LRARARNALLAPLATRKVPELIRDDIRKLIEGNYRIVYQVLEDRPVVLTVFEGHHLLPREKMDSSV
jgi:mRNA-degrading endonuclease RelE of RelBE toxin-antitoxin system